MSQDATSGIGSRMATQIGNTVTAAGERVDAALGYAKDRTSAVTESALHLADGGWNSLKGAVGKVPYTQFLIGLGAGFCLGWFVRRQSFGNH